MFDLLVAGEINPDLILSSPDLEVRFDQVETLVEKSDLAMGSSSVIFACGAARLGLKTAFIGVVGDDLLGRYMLQSMQQAGVDVSQVIIDPTLQTGISVILSRRDDRALLTHLGAINALRAEQIGSSLLAQARHLHVASYFLQTGLQPGLPDLFQRARRLGLTTSLDPNWDPSERWSGLVELLPLVDIFLPNRAEALAISEALDVEQALQRLGSVCPLVAVKLGAAGASAWQAGRMLHAPGLQVQVVDTVGAGDSFDAGFVYGFLKKWEPELSLRLAAACGSLSARRAGGTHGQPTLSEALDALEIFGE